MLLRQSPAGLAKRRLAFGETAPPGRPPPDPSSFTNAKPHFGIKITHQHNALVLTEF